MTQATSKQTGYYCKRGEPAYLEVHIPRKVDVTPGDRIRPFAEIDKLLTWYFNPKNAFR
jgi:hypothetical protein